MMIAEVQRLIKAPVEKVWAAAGDFTVSPIPEMSFEIVQEGDAANGGIGCIRRVKLGRSIYHERLEAIDPLKSYSYSMISGGPFTSYFGTVTLTPEDDGTRLRWSTEFTPKYPGIGWIARRISKNNYNMFIDGIEEKL